MTLSRAKAGVREQSVKTAVELAGPVLAAQRREQKAREAEAFERQRQEREQAEVSRRNLMLAFLWTMRQ